MGTQRYERCWLRLDSSWRYHTRNRCFRRPVDGHSSSKRAHAGSNPAEGTAGTSPVGLPGLISLGRKTWRVRFPTPATNLRSAHSWPRSSGTRLQIASTPVQIRASAPTGSDPLVRMSLSHGDRGGCDSHDPDQADPLDHRRHRCSLPPRVDRDPGFRNLVRWCNPTRWHVRALNLSRRPKLLGP